MPLAVLRARAAAQRLHQTLRATRVGTSRTCSSSTGHPKGYTWELLNRIPTPACLDPAAPQTSTSTFFPPEIEALYRGNQRFRDAVAASATPNVLKDLAAQGQRTSMRSLNLSKLLKSRGCRTAVFVVGLFRQQVRHGTVLSLLRFLLTE